MTHYQTHTHTHTHVWCGGDEFHVAHDFILGRIFYRGADRSLAWPGRKQANVSVRMSWISFGALPCSGKKNLMTAHVSMLLKSHASLTCFRDCFLPDRAKDLSAHRYCSEFLNDSLSLPSLMVQQNIDIIFMRFIPLCKYWIHQTKAFNIRQNSFILWGWIEFYGSVSESLSDWLKNWEKQ